MVKTSTATIASMSVMPRCLFRFSADEMDDAMVSSWRLCAAWTSKRITVRP
jgi:hypothetical protein